MPAPQGPLPFLTTAPALFTVSHLRRHPALNGSVHFLEMETYFGILLGLAAFTQHSLRIYPQIFSLL